MSNNRRFVPETTTSKASDAKFVELGKMNKRDRYKLNNNKRNTWSINPVSRVKPSGKVYNRKKVTDNGND